MNTVAEAGTAVLMGKHVSGRKYSVLVVPHGSILIDFHIDDAWVAGFVTLFQKTVRTGRSFKKKGCFD